MNIVAKLGFSLLLSLLLATTSLAQTAGLAAHTIQLNYRQADEVMSLIKPFLHPEGIMRGEGYKILVRTTAENFRDLQQFVAEVDVAQRLLLVSVTVDREQVMAETKPTARDERKVLEDMQSKQYSTARRDKSALTQQVRVLEGKWANISTGESIPVGQRKRNPDGTVTESVVYKSVTSGFQILPRISGERLTLFIRPQMDSQHPEGGGRIQIRRAETSLTGKLNQWILIGGATEAAIDRPGSRLYSTKKRKQARNQIFVKVEVVQ